MNKKIDYTKEREDVPFTLDQKLFPLTKETEKALAEMVQILNLEKENNLLKGEII